MEACGTRQTKKITDTKYPIQGDTTMNNDRRTFLDSSTAPRKPLPAPLTEGAMKAAMEDWLTALPKPAVKEFFGVAKKFFNPKDKKKADAKNLEILKKYKIKPLINDPSHRESLNALSCCLDMLIGGQGEMPWESVEVDGDSIEEVTTEAKDTARAKHNAAVLRAAGGAKAYQAQKMAKQPILDREISEFVERLNAKQIILLKKLIAARIAAAAELLRGNRGGYQGGNQIGNDYPGQYGNQGGNQIGNY